jgi:3-oxoacyl-[acyl-carrier-protein] synthase III
MQKMRAAKLVASSAYVPERIISNSFFNELLGEDVDTWLRENVAIYNRRWCNESESTADLCEKAAVLCLQRAGLGAEALDLIIVATDTPEYISPSTASVVQYRLGAKAAGTYDLNSACAGFVSALQTAAFSIQANPSFQHVLVIGGYAMSKFLNMTDKKTVTLFADGAGAMLLSSTETEKPLGFRQGIMKTLGQYHDWMGIYGGGTHTPVSKETFDHKDHLLRFVNKFPKELNPDMWTSMIHELCEKEGIQPVDIDHYCITQININSIKETMQRINQPMEKAPTIMHEYGYTGSACIPMAFESLTYQGRIPEEKKILFLGSGGGLSFSGALFYT